MKMKRFICVIISVMLMASALTAAIPAAGAENGAGDAAALNTYFYDQLTADQRVFYDAMVKMYEEGTFKTGTGSLDMTSAGLLSQEKVESYMDGGDPAAGSILSDYGAAKDAFYADHPSVFYVDFSNLSIRVTSGSDGYHVYIGTGRTDSYYTKGFESVSDVERAISDYEAALAVIVDGARDVTPRVGQSSEAAMVEYVHDAITHTVTYRLENACKPENIGFVRTSYGALVKHEGVCEAYTRAFKDAMDQLGIPCVMVSGVFLHNADTPEVHIWDCVRIDGEWYGVDATMDDPKTSAPKGRDGVDGYENHEYLLTGDFKMSQKHVPIGIMSSANYEFTYPELADEDYGVNVITRDHGFTVKFKEDGTSDDGEVAAGEFYISYNGMGCAAAREQGYWFLERDFTVDEETGELVTNGWYYILTDVYNLDDHEDYLHLSYAQVELLEFAVTAVAPGPYLEDPYTYMWYQGDVGGIDAQSGMIRNENGTYKAPPYPKYVTPEMNLKMIITGKPFHVTIEWNDELVPASPDAVVGVTIECEDTYGKNRPEAAGRASITNIEWDGGRVVSFDFRPSEYFSDDSMFYFLSVTGLVGAKSGKAPIPISYGVANKTSFCALRADGFNWHVFAQPALIENCDLSMSGWEMSDGTEVSELLRDRMTLVASTTTPKETEVMNGLLEGTGDDIIPGSSQTYNISLTMCSGCLKSVKDGQALHISLGFPEGYGPDDDGVTFKAYHFIKNKAGETVDVEEIPCRVTRYGLIIECYSFSPFAIAAVRTDGDTSSDERGVFLSGTRGGKIEFEGGPIFELMPGTSAHVAVTADKGCVIETLTVAGKVIADATGKTYYELRVSYDELAAGYDNIVNVSFITKAVHAADVASGETAAVIPAVEFHAHDYGEYVVEDNGHYRLCRVCGEPEAKAEHAELYGGCEVCGSGVTLGDLNGDGIITNADALMVFRNIYNAEVYRVNKFAADVDRNGRITNADALAIFKYIFNSVENPIGE